MCLPCRSPAVPARGKDGVAARGANTAAKGSAYGLGNGTSPAASSECGLLTPSNACLGDRESNDLPSSSSVSCGNRHFFASWLAPCDKNPVIRPTGGSVDCHEGSASSQAHRIGERAVLADRCALAGGRIVNDHLDARQRILLADVFRVGGHLHVTLHVIY